MKLKTNDNDMWRWKCGGFKFMSIIMTKTTLNQMNFVKVLVIATRQKEKNKDLFSEVRNEETHSRLM